MINSSQENTYQPREKRPYDPQNCEKNRDTCHNGQNWGTTSTFLTQLLNLGDLILPCWSYFLLVIGVCLWTPCSWPSGLLNRLHSHLWNPPGEQKRRRIQGLLASCLKRKARRRRSHAVHERRMSSHNPCSLYHAQCCHCTTPKLTESFAVDQAASLKLTHKRNET